MRSSILHVIKCLPPYIIKWIVVSLYMENTIGLSRLARALLTLIGSCKICYMFQIKAGLLFNFAFLKVQFALKKVSPITNIF